MTDYMLGIPLITGAGIPCGGGRSSDLRVRSALAGGCPRCGVVYDRVAGPEPDGSIKLVCAGCSTAYWTEPVSR
jgi:hypothetical protein